MSLRNIVEKKLISCKPDSSIKDVAEKMSSEDVGAVLVLNEDKKPEGIITDRDIVLRCVVGGADCGTTRAEDIMTKTVVTVALEDGIYDVIQAMKKNEVRRVAVVDEDDRAVGLLSFGDIFQLLGKELYDLTAPSTPDKAKIVKAA